MYVYIRVFVDVVIEKASLSLLHKHLKM